MSEESKGKIRRKFEVDCGGGQGSGASFIPCCRSASASSASGLRRSLKEWGWVFDGKIWRCPECAGFRWVYIRSGSKEFEAAKKAGLKIR